MEKFNQQGILHAFSLCAALGLSPEKEECKDAVS
jgi:hypothetical protein